MTGTFAYARSSVRTHRAALAGGFAIILLSTLLITVTGTWLQAGVELSGAGNSHQSGELLALASSFAGTTVVITLFIVASVFTQALRPRAQQLALLRTIGGTAGQIRRLVAAEMFLLFALSSPLGILAGSLVAPVLSGTLSAAGAVPVGFTPAVSPSAIFGTVLLIGPTVLFSAFLAVRSVTRSSAMQATRENVVDAPSLGRGRAITPITLTVLGVGSACVPFVVSGFVGTASAASSAILLVIAAAVGGSVVISTCARWLERVVLGRMNVSLDLAVRAARGYSRRLTGVIIPLALLVALGLVQTGSGGLAAQAGEKQLETAMRADLVVEEADLETLELVKGASGVESVGANTSIPASVRTDRDEPTGIGFLDALSWEASALTVFPGEEFVAPEVTRGSLDDLADRHAVAMSTDMATMLFAPVGGTIEMELAGGESIDARIVAVYDGSFAFGDYLVGPSFPGADSPEVRDLFILTDDGVTFEVQNRLRSLGVETMSGQAYIQHTVEAAAGEQLLSTGATLILLVFIGLAAANTLVMVTASRRGEFRLLRRLGTTSGQLLTMSMAESLFVGATAIILGTACALPALLGISWGLLGSVAVGFSLLTFGLLAMTVLVVAVCSMVPATVWQRLG
ncbi:ABC transporter permease [Nesterenkonia rhizosphaerae]|uniref:ABC3 transporter permease C-terminal domain-containing protein n=1 Tax=Nesterenkonia rhizosphaerae TaxID=1348272 RepID=A0ABP9FVV9_9MICC